MSRKTEPYLRDLEFRGFVQGLTYLDDDYRPLCHYFGGIPYALPPVGQFRWQKPRSLPPCYRYGSRAHPGIYTGNCSLCPQSGFNGELEEALWDEDCLQCNIWIPAGEPPKEGWPVLFWIHGGFLQFGTPRNMNLAPMLSETNCKAIVVTPAYRLNVFGFLASPELAKSKDFTANAGFWDQRLALEWTWQNISYFGGNASNITLGGYSAGSHSTFHQLAYDLGLPDSKSIIKRVLMLSNGPGMQPRSLDEAQVQFNEFLSILHIPSNLPSFEKLSRLRELDAKTLIKATLTMKYHQFRGISDDAFILTSLFTEIDTGIFAQRLRARNIKIIMGECSDEHFVYGTWRPPRQNTLASMVERLQADYSRPAVDGLCKYYYPNNKLPAGCNGWPSAFGRLYADIQIHHLTRGFAASLVRHGAGHLLYRYRIEWRAQSCDKKWPKEWGVTHETDMAIWFWGYGDVLGEREKEIVREAFHDNLGKFLRGEEMQWGTEKPMQMRCLKGDGTVVCEEDGRLDEGIKVWELLRRVGATKGESARL